MSEKISNKPDVPDQVTPVSWPVRIGIIVALILGPLFLGYLLLQAVMPFEEEEVKYVADDRTGELIESTDKTAKTAYPEDQVESLVTTWTALLIKGQSQSVLTEFQTLIDTYVLLPEYGLSSFAHDANLIQHLESVARVDQFDVLSALSVPEVKLYYALTSNPLVYMSLVEDKSTLVPTDVSYVQLMMGREVLEVEEDLPELVKHLVSSTQAVYEYQVKLDTETFTTYVFLLLDGSIAFSGLYGETSRDWFDANYWLSNESLLSSIPIIAES